MLVCQSSDIFCVASKICYLRVFSIGHGWNFELRDGQMLCMLHTEIEEMPEYTEVKLELLTYASKALEFHINFARFPRLKVHRHKVAGYIVLSDVK